MKIINAKKSQPMHINLEYVIFWNSFRKLIWDDTSCDSECKYIIPQATNKSICVK